jgi:hypothetical protein
LITRFSILQIMAFPWDILITGLSTLAAGLGGAWIKGNSDLKRDKQTTDLAAQSAREQHQRDAYASLVIAARQVLRNQRQLRIAYAANESGTSGDAIVADAFISANQLGDDLNRAVVVTELLGSEAARTHAAAILKAARSTAEIFQARSLSLYSAEKSRTRSAGLPSFDDDEADARCDAFEAAIGMFLDVVRAETRLAPG